MYKTIGEAERFIDTLASLIPPRQESIYIAAPFTAIAPLHQKVKKSHYPFIIGAQNMNDASEGAFTGEIAGRMLKEAGAEFVLLGHSERRQLFYETDEIIQKKLSRALKDDLMPILCVGETRQQRNDGQTEKVLEKQLSRNLKDITLKSGASMMIAYEPVWAIGTGDVATPQDAEKSHEFIRKFLIQKFGEEIANKIALLYGGSVKPENAASLIEQPTINGVLVGGASLDPQSFANIIKAVS